MLFKIQNYVLTVYLETEVLNILKSNILFLSFIILYLLSIGIKM